MARRAIVVFRDRRLQRALRDFQKYGRKSATKAVNKAGGLWTSFAYSKTRISNKTKVRNELMTKVHADSGGPVKGGKLGAEFRGTRVAAIVGAQLKKRGQKVPPGRFYQMCRSFLAMRVRSVGYWKAGFIPALRAFRQKGQRSRGGRFKQPIPGRAKRATLRQTRTHAFLANRADDYLEKESHTLFGRAAEVAAMLRTWTLQDFRANARKARLRR